jgi:predicted nucleic acid-binding protein
VIIVDTSIAVQWFVAEPDAPAAELLLPREDLVAPDILLLETANVLRKKLRDGDIMQEQAIGSFAFLRASFRQLVPFGELLERAFSMAVEVGHPVYDCVFLACAESTNGVLVTRDAKFVDRASGKYPGVLRLFSPEWAKSLP